MLVNSGRVWVGGAARPPKLDREAATEKTHKKHTRARARAGAQNSRMVEDSMATAEGPIPPLSVCPQWATR
jgi:hypothetical protein